MTLHANPDRQMEQDVLQAGVISGAMPDPAGPFWFEHAQAFCAEMERRGYVIDDDAPMGWRRTEQTQIGGLER